MTHGQGWGERSIMKAPWSSPRGFDYAGSFSGGLAEVSAGGRGEAGDPDRSGKFIWKTGEMR